MEDAVFAKTESDLNWFWTIREDVHVLISQIQNDQQFDISLPIGSIGVIVEEIIKKLEKTVGVEAVFPFGHVADGNIHFVIGKENNSEELTQTVNEIVHKKKYLIHSRSANEIELMKNLKRTLDPKNLLNRGKLFNI